MTAEVRSLLIWTAAFLVFELPAHYGLVPWFTLSRTVWNGEAWWWPVGLFVLAFVAVLTAHLEIHLSVRWLILLVVAGTFLFISHALEHLVRSGS